MVTYHGKKTERGCVVMREEGDETLDFLKLRLDVRGHSPTGFNWGYGGSGPAQLALALLADATGDDDLAQAIHQRFKWQVTAKLTVEWTMTDDDIRAKAKALAADLPDDWREDYRDWNDEDH